MYRTYIQFRKLRLSYGISIVIPLMMQNGWVHVVWENNSYFYASLPWHLFWRFQNNWRNKYDIFSRRKEWKEMVLDFSGFNFDQGFIYKSLLWQLSWNKDYQFTSEIKIFKDWSQFLFCSWRNNLNQVVHTV